MFEGVGVSDPVYIKGGILLFHASLRSIIALHVPRANFSGVSPPVGASLAHESNPATTLAIY
jgi:hypothetical protein